MTKWSALIALTLIVDAGCGREAKPTTTPTGPAAMRAEHHPMVMMCPAMAPGVEVDLVETPSGVVVMFVAPPEEVEPLRANVHQMAESHSRQAVSGGGETDVLLMPEVIMSAEDTDQGAQLVIEAADPADIKPLQLKMQKNIQQMRAGGCAEHMHMQPPMQVQ